MSVGRRRRGGSGRRAWKTAVERDARPYHADGAGHRPYHSFHRLVSSADDS